MVWLLTGYSASVLLSLAMQKMNDYFLLYCFARNGYKLKTASRIKMEYDDFKGWGNFIPVYNLFRNILYVFEYANNTDPYIQQFIESDGIRKMTDTEQRYFDEKPSFFRMYLLNHSDYPDEDLHDEIRLNFNDGSGFSYYVDEDGNYVVVEKFGVLENKTDEEIFKLILDYKEIIDVITRSYGSEDELDSAIKKFNDAHCDKKLVDESDVDKQMPPRSDKIAELRDLRESIVTDKKTTISEKIKKIGKKSNR